MIKDIVTEINEDDFNVKNGGQVEIIGWIYQYYNTELKDKVLKKKKYKESDIPAVTQLFTPDWIVKYLVENSLGRYWINILNAKGNKNNSKQIADEFGWNYFMSSAEQSEKVQIKINNDSKNLSDTNVQDITLIDVSMGSGHILVYAFEVFMQIYLSEGYSQRDAAKLILNNNLYGLDIDTRAFQLAYFSIMMQARKYNRRILKSDIKPNVFDIPEYNDLDYMQFADLVDDKTLKVIQSIIETFRNGNNYGSLIHFASDLDWDNLIKISNNEELGQLSFGTIKSNQKIKELQEILNISKILSSKYTINITNPPYMGSGKMNPVLSKYVGKNYPNSKSDLFATFMERTKELTTNDGYYALITQHSWMFLSSFEKLRHELTKDTLINMAHLGTRAFEDIGGEVVQSTAFVFQNKQVRDYVGTYERLVDFNSQDKKEQAYLKAVENPQINYVYRTNQANFSKIPGSPIAYWFSNRKYNIFEKSKNLGKLYKSRTGLQTSDRNRFLRLWFEISIKKLNQKWIPYAKGGKYQKWYGNMDYVVNWENNGDEIKNYVVNKYKYLHGNYSLVVKNETSYFKKGIVTSKITSGKLSFRLLPDYQIFSDATTAVFPTNNLIFFLALSNSKVIELISDLNPTINFQASDYEKLPIIFSSNNLITNKAELCINITRSDWDSFEISWDFQQHPLLNHIADDKQLFSTKLLEYSYVCAKIVTTVPFGGLK